MNDRDTSYSLPLSFQTYFPTPMPQSFTAALQPGVPFPPALSASLLEPLRADLLLPPLEQPHASEHEVTQVESKTKTKSKAGRPSSSYRSVIGDEGKGVNQRKDNSLHAITSKFLCLIEESEDGVLDLNEVSQKLKVQKRRIYDITNVLEGIGLIQKQSKNTILWKGRSTSNTTEKEAIQMDLDEAQMDQLLELKQTELKQYLYDNSPWAYVNYEDIKRLDMMQGQTIFAIRAQPGTKLEVPDPDIGGTNKRRYEMFLSGQHPIDVYLVSQLEGEEHFEVTDSPAVPNQELEPEPEPEPVPEITLIKPQGESLFDMCPAEDLLKPSGDFDYFSLFNSTFPSVSPDGISSISDFL